jgi:hypothetical protein
VDQKNRREQTAAPRLFDVMGIILHEHALVHENGCDKTWRCAMGTL